MRNGTGRPQRLLLLGGTSEIGAATLRALDLGPGAAVVLAGRDEAALLRAAAELPGAVVVSVDRFDARDPDSVAQVIDRAFAGGDVDVVIAAFGVLGDQQALERDPAGVGDVLTVNVVSHVRALLEATSRMRLQGHGTYVALSSIAAVRPRRANFVYGAAKAALDAAARGAADALHGSGVRVLVVRPGFVVGRMTAGMSPAPWATTPEVVGQAVADAIRTDRTEVWVPARLAVVAMVMRLVPRRIWQRLRR